MHPKVSQDATTASRPVDSRRNNKAPPRTRRDGTSQKDVALAASTAPPLSAGHRHKRTPSKSVDSGDKLLQKPISTPQLRNSNMSDSDGEKKQRNKLGYQRISIACAHCRRRKIRCLVAENDAKQRCQNCIRLKKECVFYPVEHQTAMDRMDASGNSTAPSTTSSGVSNSPPHLNSSGPFEPQRAPYNGFVSSSGYPGIPIPPHGPFPNQEYSYSHPPDVNAPWNHGPYDPASLGSPDDPRHAPTRYGDPVLGAHASHYPHSLEHGQPLGYGYHMENDSSRWSQITPGTRTFSQPEVFTDATFDSPYRTSQPPFNDGYHHYPASSMDSTYLPLPTHASKADHPSHLVAPSPPTDGYNHVSPYSILPEPRNSSLTLPSHPTGRVPPPAWFSGPPSHAALGESRSLNHERSPEKYLVTSQTPG